MAKRNRAAHLAKFKFKPGQPSANPNGRPKNPIPDALKKATKQTFRRIIRAVVKGNIDKLEEMANSRTLSALEVSVAACYVKAIQSGDYRTVEHIVQRIVGKIPDELVVRSTNFNTNRNGEVDEAKMKKAWDDWENEI